MKTTYITLKPGMARAFREGRKTMTRRVAKHSCDDRKQCEHSEIMNTQKSFSWNGNNCPTEIGIARHCEHGSELTLCPYGQVGDKLILGTTWATLKNYDGLKPTELTIDAPIWSYFKGDEKPDNFGRLRTARFLPVFLRDQMPTVTLKTVGVERVREISYGDAIREGIFETPRKTGFGCWSTYGIYDRFPTARGAFKYLWDKINLKRGYGWDSNPLVWSLGW